MSLTQLRNLGIVANAGISTTKLGTGAVLQVVTATYGTYTASTTTTFVDTGLTASITPTSASNKILVFAQMNGITKINNTGIEIRLLRGATTIANFGGLIAYTGTSLDNRIGGAGLNYLDSPNTTSSVTYKTMFKSVFNIADVAVQDNGGLSTITLMEIAA